MQINVKSIFKTNLLFFSFIVVLISYMPNIIESYYVTFKIVNYILFGSLFFLTIKIKQIVYERIIYVYFFILFLFALETIILINLGLNIDFKDLIELAIPFIAIIIGYNINISNKKYHNLLLVYCIMASIVSVLSVYYYIGSFTILDEYMVEEKNSLGAIISNSLAIMICMLFLKNLGKYKKILIILGVIILCGCLLVTRARSAFLAIFLCSLTLIWLVFRSKRHFYLIVGTLFVSLVILYLYIDLTLPQFLQDFFIGSSDLSDLNSVSSGRIDINIAAINFISENPMFGQLTNSYYLELVHNYVLLKVARYGLLGSFLLIFLYFYLIWYIFSKILKINEIRLEHFGYIVMIIPLFISLLEPTFPYGPGSVQVIVYFMLGYSLKNSSKRISQS